jgi:hypothetical protein
VRIFFYLMINCAYNFFCKCRVMCITYSIKTSYTHNLCIKRFVKKYKNEKKEACADRRPRPELVLRTWAEMPSTKLLACPCIAATYVSMHVRPPCSPCFVLTALTIFKKTYCTDQLTRFVYTYECTCIRIQFLKQILFNRFYLQQ